jgi:phage regulator Rha-like protein
MTKVLIIFKMKDLIKKILKEEFDDFEWVNEIPQITPAEEFLYDLMSSLTIVESKKWKNWMTYKDKNGKILMADNINTGTERPKLYVDYTQIWEKLEGYGLKKEEIKALCVRMLEVTHKRKVFTAFSI